MGMFSRKDMIRLFGPLLVEQLLAVCGHGGCGDGSGCWRDGGFRRGAGGFH